METHLVLNRLRIVTIAVLSRCSAIYFCTYSSISSVLYMDDTDAEI